jgi:hypothetical protein
LLHQKAFIIVYAPTGVTHPPSWEGQSAKRLCQRSGGWGRRSSGTLAPSLVGGSVCKTPLSTKRWVG